MNGSITFFSKVWDNPIGKNTKNYIKFEKKIALVLLISTFYFYGHIFSFHQNIEAEKNDVTFSASSTELMF
ncbi:hypothetical protein BpHYR1_035367 [Brachionus plicatilis]|uniref:Uncharacterized protein n=1 Tax=Brachionus plicatilis TaxID=10195 RepID=A0A3M7S943_BRAPC|nr:hypothetical protein BpHYR1_035367 [Brachionus plicatilis]